MNNRIILEWSRHPKYNTEAQTIKEKTDNLTAKKNENIKNFMKKLKSKI